MSNLDFEFSKPIGVDVQGLKNQGFGMVQFDRGDDGQVVIFRWERRQNAAKSAEAGRPVFERVEFVMIHPPGERLNIIDRPVVESDKQRWPRQYASFIQNRTHVPEGTPVEQLFPTHPEIPATLRAVGIHIVEQLARLSPQAIAEVGMGAQDWVNRARRYLESATSTAVLTSLENKLSQKDHEINALKSQIADLMNKYNALSSAMAMNTPIFAATQAQHQLGIDAANRQLNPAPRVLDMPVKDWAEPPAGWLTPDDDLSPGNPEFKP